MELLFLVALFPGKDRKHTLNRILGERQQRQISVYQPAVTVNKISVVAAHEIPG
jgi:hypothetical protein